MSRNLLPCIIALFNVRVLHIFNMGRMALHNEGGDFDGLLLIASNSELETLVVDSSKMIKPLDCRIWFQI